MTKKDYNEFNINEHLTNPFKNKLKIVVNAILVLISIVSFFGASNIPERGLSIFCILILCILGKSKRKCFQCISRIWAFVLILNLVATCIVGKPFLGLLSDERINQYSDDKFNINFSEALYKLSVNEYEEAFKDLKKIKKYVPEEYRIEYYLWCMETAAYARNYEQSARMFDEVMQNIPEVNSASKKLLFEIMPIANLVNCLNDKQYDLVVKETQKYQSTNEQIFYLMELYALCLRGDIAENKDRIRELLLIYREKQDSFDCFREVKYDLLAYSASYLEEDYPEYAVILYSLLYAESKSAFYEEFLYFYPEENNLFNIRSFSMEFLEYVKDIFDKGYKILQLDETLVQDNYRTIIEDFGLYIGSEKILVQKFENVDKFVFDSKFKNWELYNIISISKDKYLGVWLEGKELIGASVAHFYVIQEKNGEICFVPLKIGKKKLKKDTLMAKLFIVEPTSLEGVYLISSILGTGEYLQLDKLDVINKTCTQIEIPEETYHTSEFQFDKNTNSYTLKYEIYNNIDPNMSKKVGGRTEAKINFEQNIVIAKNSYFDPALQFYVQKRNEELIFPLVNLNSLNGKEIKNDTLLEKIRKNSTPYYKYSPLQQCYEFFLNDVHCQFSGITIVYDYGTDDEATFFYFVKREKEEVKLIEIYEIVENRLVSVYK